MDETARQFSSQMLAVSGGAAIATKQDLATLLQGATGERTGFDHSFFKRVQRCQQGVVLLKVVQKQGRHLISTELAFFNRLLLGLGTFDLPT